MFTTLAIAGTFILTNLLKRYVQPKFGDTGVHVTAFLIAFSIIVIKGLMTSYPSFGHMIVLAGQYLVASLALYQILIKQLKDKFTIPKFLG